MRKTQVTQQRRQALVWEHPCAARREELGEYFAVDIGGTNYRVIYVKLSPDKGKVVSAQLDAEPLWLTRLPRTRKCQPTG